MILRKVLRGGISKMATGLTGFIGGLQNRFFGFDSRRRLQEFIHFTLRTSNARSYYIRRPREALRSWTRTSLEWHLFGDRGAKHYRTLLKQSAYNKAYIPPVRADHIARDTILRLEREVNRWKSEAIAAKKSLSQAKRGNDQ